VTRLRGYALSARGVGEPMAMTLGLCSSHVHVAAGVHLVVVLSSACLPFRGLCSCLRSNPVASCYALALTCLVFLVSVAPCVQSCHVFRPGCVYHLSKQAANCGRGSLSCSCRSRLCAAPGHQRCGGLAFEHSLALGCCYMRLCIAALRAPRAFVRRSVHRHVVMPSGSAAS
jgi:hypothetical protein